MISGRGKRAPMPAHISSLMWAVAESQDRAAMGEFTTKYPQFADEMNKCFEMVAGLKGSRPPHVRATRVPPFKRVRPEPEPVQRWVWVGAALGLVALGYASFELARSYAATASPPVNVVSPSPSPGPAGVQGFEPGPQPVAQGSGTPNTMSPSEPPPDLRSVELSDVDLITALRAIAAQTGYVIELAPGFPEKHLVRVSYANLTGLDMLRDMGARLGFSVFEQERNRLLLVPAVDPNASSTRPLGEVTEAPPGPHEGPVDGDGSRAKTPRDPANDSADPP